MRLILDGTVVRVRLDRKATSISLLVVIGVRADDWFPGSGLPRGLDEPSVIAFHEALAVHGIHEEARQTWAIR